MKAKKLLAMLLSALLVLTALAPAAFAEKTRAEKANLKFHEDGSFRIVNYADIQDDATLSGLTKSFIRKPAPLLGEDNESIFAEMLGFDTAKLEELKKSGVI